MYIPLHTGMYLPYEHVYVSTMPWQLQEYSYVRMHACNTMILLLLPWLCIYTHHVSMFKIHNYVHAATVSYPQFTLLKFIYTQHIS